MVALLETADSFKELGVHADRVEAYIALCKDVAQFWTDHRSKVHQPSGLYGFCYSEFCETTEIGGVRHNEDYFAFNSNSMMAAALLRLHELTGEAQWGSVASRVLASLTSDSGPMWCAANATRSEEECALSQWDFGRNNLYWQAHPPGLEVIEDTAHAGWDLYGMAEAVRFGGLVPSVQPSTIGSIWNALKYRVLNATGGGPPVVAKTIDGAASYGAPPSAPFELNYYVGEWTALAAPIVATMGCDQALEYLSLVDAAMDSALNQSGYTYYNFIADGWQAATLLPTRSKVAASQPEWSCGSYRLPVPQPSFKADDDQASLGVQAFYIVK